MDGVDGKGDLLDKVSIVISLEHDGGKPHGFSDRITRQNTGLERNCNPEDRFRDTTLER